MTDYAQFLAILFLFVVGIGIAAALVILVVFYISDRSQSTHAIRRNFPVVGRFRYLFENLGEFFRQYFFAMDREEMPFNRALRSWVYKAAHNVDMTQPFGSTRSLNTPGEVIFVSSMFPVQETDTLPASEIVVGTGTDHPYTPDSFFNISGMSFGAISRPAVLALSNGARRAGCWMNTGEGSLSPYHIEGGASIVLQIGTAKYGVRNHDGTMNDQLLREVASSDQVKMIEVKLSQGAKPGKGGILPGVKVSAEIAKIRGIPEGEDSISPNRHPEISNYGELLDFVNRVRDATGKPVGIKMVMGDPEKFRELCDEILKRGVDKSFDFLTLDSADGGTGAAPLALIDYVGLRLRESLPLAQKILCEAGLRDRIKLFSSGKLINPAGVAWALATGADAVTSARGFMFALGCIQALQCNKNTCPAGITTQNKSLQRGLNPLNKADRVYNYHRHVTHEVEVIAHSCGVAEPRLLRPEHTRIIADDGSTRPGRAPDWQEPESINIEALKPAKPAPRIQKKQKPVVQS